MADSGLKKTEIAGASQPVDPGFLAEVEAACHAGLSRCYQCKTCSLGCPVAPHMDHPPHELVRLVQLGLKQEALTCGTLGICVACETCTARCPNGIHIDAMIDALRIMARRAGLPPKHRDVRSFHNAFLGGIRTRGKVFEVGMMVRLKLATLNLFEDAISGMFMFLKGKLGLLPHGIKGKDEVRRLFDETIDKKRP